MTKRSYPLYEGQKPYRVLYRTVPENYEHIWSDYDNAEQAAHDADALTRLSNVTSSTIYDAIKQQTYVLDNEL